MSAAVARRLPRGTAEKAPVPGVATTDGGVVLALPLPAAALASGYSEDVLRLAIRRGDLTARYANTKPVIRLAELDEWLAALPTEAPPKH